MKISKLVAVLGCLALFPGCTTKPVSTEDMKHPPDGRVISYAFFEPRPGARPIVIKRDSEFRIMPCMVRVSVDRELVVDLAPGEGVMLYVDEGERFLVAHFCPGVEGGEIIELFIRVGEGEHSTFRISGEGAGSGITFQPTSF